MSAQIRVLSGARTGLVVPLEAEGGVIGRQADALVRFSPELDLAVSGRHAEIYSAQGQWRIRDLGSRNGTIVNGRRISEETPLQHGDRITFGADGPSVSFEVVHVAARWRRRRQLGMAAAAGAALALGIGTLSLVERRRQADWERDRAEMRQQSEQALAAAAATVRSLEGQVEALAAALQQSQDAVRSAQASLRQAELRGDTERIPRLRRQLEQATVTLHQQQRAAALDFEGIQRANRLAVARVFVESETGEVHTGTAFAVRPNATLLTNRHVVAGTHGNQAPRRIGIQFSDSEQVWPARILRVSEKFDLAVLKIDNIVGRVPTIHGFNLRADTIAPGAAVAWIGFPEQAGQDGASDGNRTSRAAPVLAAGVVSEWSAAGLAIEGYGAAGASGSPFFDANGQVIGVLLGGRRHKTGHRVYGVPASAAAELLRTLP